MGTLSILPMQQTQRVYAANTQKQWQENLILLADPDGACYHVEGCIHVQNNALPIGLQAAYKMGIPGDARCNPPSYDARN